jgi:membrane-bound serine protease (ClpP class)
MLLKIIIVIIAAYVLFELIEHAVLPLVWIILKKKRRTLTGAEGLIGEIGQVRAWQRTEGKVFVHGELWQAVCNEPLSPGDKVEVEDIQGLMLEVKRWQPNQD